VSQKKKIQDKECNKMAKEKKRYEAENIDINFKGKKDQSKR
jgi:hypothetical protein